MVFWREPGLVLDLQFAERSGATVYDLSGNGNNGTIYGASWRRGPLLGVLYFDGVDDYIILPTVDALKNNKSWTIELFVKFHGIDGSLVGMVDEYETLDHNGWWIDLANGDINYTYEYGDGVNETFTWDTDLQAGRWYHIVLRRTTSCARIFINGVKYDAKCGAEAEGGDAVEYFRLGTRYMGENIHAEIALFRGYAGTLADDKIYAHYRYLMGRVQRIRRRKAAGVV